MKLVTASEAQEIDHRSAELITEKDFFMENVSRQISDWISKNFTSHKKIIFLCGPGNNGGDGYCCARQLIERGYNQLTVFHASPGTELAKQKLKQLDDRKIILFKIDQLSVWPQKLKEADLVVDAVFGVGLNREISGPWAQAFEDVNRSKKPVLSIDLPSGLNATEGFIWGSVIKAKWTFSVLPWKSGLFMNAGPECAGRIIAVAPGFPDKVVNSVARSVRLIGKKSCALIRPHRNWQSNKTHFGHLGVLGGSTGMEGAGVLAGLGALRSGVGYVTLISPASSAMNHPEFLSMREDQLSLEKFKALVLGPGLKTEQKHSDLLRKLKKSKIPVVLDAGILSTLKAENLYPVPENWILTPHAGELSRLIGISAQEIEKERLKVAEKAQKILGGILVLKGFHTVVRGAARSYIINSGNPALAKAGTGDVLSGIIGSFLAQGLSPLKAACLGVYMHGAAADLWLQEGNSQDSLLPTDLIEKLAKLI